MKAIPPPSAIWLLCAALACALAPMLPSISVLAAARYAPELSSYIVESGSAAAARRAVLRVGGEVGAPLEEIHGVVAWLDLAQHAQLCSSAGIRCYADRHIRRLE